MEKEYQHKVLVTGANGFLGKYVVKELSTQGFYIIMTDLQESARIFSGHEYHQIDLVTELDKIEILISKVDTVIHLASIVGSSSKHFPSTHVFAINISASAAIVNICASLNRRLLFASSAAIYGMNDAAPWTEDHNRVFGSVSSSDWTYGLGKSTIEQLIIDLSKEKPFNFIVPRLFNLFGPGQPEWTFIPQAINRAKRNLPIEIYGDGERKLSFTYVEDVAVIFRKLLESNFTGILNVGNPICFSLNETCAILSKHFPFLVVNTKVINVEIGERPRISRPNLNLLNEALPAFEFTSLEKGLKTILDLDR